ncbi:hypothetical protein KIW84_023363 [Lathyrus oleraceus]|uniref:CRAL-TRIO domain-containing protein n=1 Tax=Pisum sativum TaxID=3888 RepID=A0A9D5BB52_PEA|nr:hypothetical protein KIW84_023363 [Pisum sativum]
MHIVNAGTGFKRMLWPAAQKFLDPKTTAKIQIPESKSLYKLQEVIDSSQLPNFLGGSCTCSRDGGCLRTNKGPWNDHNIMKLERRSGSSTAESGSDFFMITHPIPDNRAASCRPEETEKWTAKHHKHKRNLSLEKTLNVSTTSTAPQVENHTVAYVNVSTGIATASNEQQQPAKPVETNHRQLEELSLLLQKNGSLSAVETLASTAICGVIYSIIGGQPLLILGVAEPAVIMYTHLYNFCKNTPDLGAELFLAWAGDLFGILITVLFFQEAIKGLIGEFSNRKVEDPSSVQIQWQYTNGLLAVIFSLELDHPAH